MPAIWKAAWTVDQKEREKAIEESMELLKYLENELKENKFFGGETIGILDIVAVYIAFWLPIIQQVVGLELLTIEKFPKLHKWSQEFTNHPVVKENLPPREKVFGFFKGRYENIFGSK